MTLKRGLSSHNSTSNWARKLKFSIYVKWRLFTCLLRVLTFQSHCNPSHRWKCGFLTIFSYFLTLFLACDALFFTFSPAEFDCQIVRNLSYFWRDFKNLGPKLRYMHFLWLENIIFLKFRPCCLLDFKFSPSFKNFW